MTVEGCSGDRAGKQKQWESVTEPLQQFPMAASPVSISLSPPAHPGQMAGGHWRGDGLHRFTNEVLQG